MAVQEFRITTTAAPVDFADLGMRSFPHPTVAYNLLLEFTLEEIQRSADVQAALTGGHITAEDEGGNPITQVDGVGIGWYKDGNFLRPVDDGVGFKFANAGDTEFLTMTRSTGNFNFTVSGAGSRALYFNSNQVRHQLGGNAGAESVEVSDNGDGMIFKVASDGVTTIAGKQNYPAAASHPVSPAPNTGDRYFNTTDQLWKTYYSSGWATWVCEESRRAQMSYGLFAHMLEVEGTYSSSQVMTGLINHIYHHSGQLPSPPPSGASVPAFAIVDDLAVTGPKLAYWDFTTAQSGWHLTSYPWANPTLAAGHVIDQISGVGSGASAWNYAMGSLIHIVNNAKVNDMTIKSGTIGPHSHAWVVRRSTSPGPTQPAASTFTNILASGTHTFTGAANTWESVTGFPAAFNVSADDWLACQYWIGVGGQTQQIAAARTAGWLNEDYGEIAGGIYVSQVGPAPGATPVPTNITATTLYGLASIDLGPQ